MQQRPKGLAARRAQRQRVLAKAKRVLRLLDIPETMACYWADNLRRCSCDLCTSRDADPHRLRADTKLAFEMQRLRENAT